jgi:hypothetical protein
MDLDKRNLHWKNWPPKPECNGRGFFCALCSVSIAVFAHHSGLFHHANGPPSYSFTDWELGTAACQAHLVRIVVGCRCTHARRQNNGPCISRVQDYTAQRLATWPDGKDFLMMNEGRPQPVSVQCKFLSISPHIYAPILAVLVCTDIQSTRSLGKQTKCFLWKGLTGLVFYFLLVWPCMPTNLLGPYSRSPCDFATMSGSQWTRPRLLYLLDYGFSSPLDCVVAKLRGLWVQVH